MSTAEHAWRATCLARSGGEEHLWTGISRCQDSSENSKCQFVEPRLRYPPKRSANTLTPMRRDVCFPSTKEGSPNRVEYITIDSVTFSEGVFPCILSIYIYINLYIYYIIRANTRRNNDFAIRLKKVAHPNGQMTHGHSSLSSECQSRRPDEDPCSVAVVAQTDRKNGSSNSVLFVRNSRSSSGSV